MASLMLRGFLKIVVLKALGDGSHSGYSLMQHVEKCMGAKPSPGSMYPLLEQLKKQGLVLLKAVGRTNEYRLTPKGKQHLVAVQQKRSECLNNLLAGMKMLSSITSEDMSFPIAMIERVQKGELPFKEINPEWDTLRNALFVMMQHGTLKQKAGAVKKILARAHQQLRKA